jgi:DNA-binding transcriptional ArsR family regulator
MKEQIDLVFRAMAHPLRREALALLARRDDVADVVELADRLGHLSEGKTDEQLRVALHHVHLPLLRDAGLVEYDARTGIARHRDSSSSDLAGSMIAKSREVGD